MKYRHDHPSCLTPNLALALHCARPFYPDHQLYGESAGEPAVSWPALSGWPTSSAELERKNAAHLAIPGANPYYVDTRENVYADVASDEETWVAGEDPVVQIANFIQIVDSRGVAQLLEAVRSGTWMHGSVDDVFFAVALHLSDERVAQLLGCRIGVVRLWFVQAQMAIFKEHVQVSPRMHMQAKNWVGTSEQDNRWRDAVQAFRERHVKGDGGEWRRLPCCEGGRIEEAFSEVVDAERGEGGEDEDGASGEKGECVENG